MQSQHNQTITHPYVQSKILTSFAKNIPQMLITILCACVLSAKKRIPCNTWNPHTIFKKRIVLRFVRISSEVSLFTYSTN